MSRKITIIAVAGAATATLAVGGAGTLASASTTSHTLKFTSVQVTEKGFSGGRFVDSDKDVQNGKVIGYDVVNGVYNAEKKTITINFAGALAGGIIYGDGHGSATSTKFTGTITGGTGVYKGIQGTITGKSTGKNDNNEQLVFTYHH